MTLIKDTSFYWPWPILEGVPLNEQWYRIRTDTELLNPIVQSTYYENTDGIRGHAALAGYEFGSQSFPNQYRIVYIDSNNELHFQCNEGTTSTPVWATLFHLDCGGSVPIQFDEATSFYLPLIVKDGIHEFASIRNTISFNNDQFYLTKDTAGNPEVNIKFPHITVTDGTNDFIVEEEIGFNNNQFYLTRSALGDPIVNIKEPILGKITVRDGIHAVVDDTISFNSSQFYISIDSQGNPMINQIGSSESGISFITISDGTHTLTDDTIKVNPTRFYLTQDSSGNPMLNLFSLEMEDGEHGHFVIVPTQDITIMEKAANEFFIDSLSGRTSTGSVQARVQVNTKTIPELAHSWFYPDPRTYTVPGYRVASGDRLQFYLTSESAANFAWSFSTRRRLF